MLIMKKRSADKASMPMLRDAPIPGRDKRGCDRVIVPFAKTYTARKKRQIEEAETNPKELQLQNRCNLLVAAATIAPITRSKKLAYKTVIGNI